MYAQAIDKTIWKTNFWDFFSNHNTWNSEGFSVEQSKLLAEFCLVPAPKVEWKLNFDLQAIKFSKG